MNIPKPGSVEQKGIRWKQHQTVLGVTGWLANSVYEVQTILGADHQDQLIELIRMFGAYQVWLAATVLIAIIDQPLVISTFTKRDVTEQEESHSRYAALYFALIIAIGWAI
ncbi:hypothetical protein [Pontibacterium sp.]|uniref:hypothetical protein n=1 Tax=Pontibacterium sp. TaxID=2036026 RepID=UPI003511DAB3